MLLLLFFFALLNVHWCIFSTVWAAEQDEEVFISKAIQSEENS